jgi:hypothetical protein
MTHHPEFRNHYGWWFFLLTINLSIYGGIITMNEEIWIEARYREADENERLYLFLQFPELRISFQEIDLEEYAANRDYVGVFDQAA